MDLSDKRNTKKLTLEQYGSFARLLVNIIHTYAPAVDQTDVI